MRTNCSAASTTEVGNDRVSRQAVSDAAEGRKVEESKRLLLVAAIAATLTACSPALPDYPTVENHWLDQNWGAEQRNWFHHASQGTMTFHVPYEWFMALEQPTLGLFNVGLVSDPAYLSRFGFIRSPADDAELPVGFAHGPAIIDPTSGSAWINPQSNQAFTEIGLTCAACHTGQLNYNGKGLLIDGGSAMTDLAKLTDALRTSIFLTKWIPGRFNRFAERVLGPGASDEAKKALRANLENVLASGEKEVALEKSVASKRVEEGFGRLDALSRIGNQVFSLDANQPANYAPTAAPVHFPHIWDTSWFDWVQYDGSIEQPMVRNAGEAMGVSALVNLSNSQRPLFDSTVDIKSLYEAEQLLAGTQPTLETGFNGLKAPKWPEGLLPAIDQARATKGAELYRELCQGCHLPPVNSPQFWDGQYWTEPNATGERYLKMPMIDIAYVGTDPAQSNGIENRQVTIPDDVAAASEGKIKTGGYGPALGATVEAVANRWYDSQTPPVPDDLRQKMNGNRKNGIRALPKYKARPLDGIWAAPPYLHNGSVPNLYALLSPLEERPKTFYLGSKEFDPVKVGYKDEPVTGGFQMDTSKPGNSNAGHEFSRDFNDKDLKGRGVIGRYLNEEERWSLIEYLKTL